MTKHDLHGTLRASCAAALCCAGAAAQSTQPAPATPARPSPRPATVEPAEDRFRVPPPASRDAVGDPPSPALSQPLSRPLAVDALESRSAEAAPLRGGGQAARGALTTVQDPEPRTFKVHDLITIVVAETSRSKSSANTKTDKKYNLDAGISEFINLDIGEWGDGGIQLSASDLPQFKADGKKKFDAKGNAGRQDDFSARITAEVIEVLPNGTILVEAFKHINMDGEEQTIRLSGMCRPEDVDASNIVQSHRLANASIEKTTKGQLKDATEKGIIARVLDALLAF